MNVDLLCTTFYENNYIPLVIKKVHVKACGKMYQAAQNNYGFVSKQVNGSVYTLYSTTSS